MTGKHVELRARQMQHFQGIYSLCSEDLCGSVVPLQIVPRAPPRSPLERSPGSFQFEPHPPGPRFHPGPRCMRGAEAQRAPSVKHFFWVRTSGCAVRRYAPCPAIAVSASLPAPTGPAVITRCAHFRRLPFADRHDANLSTDTFDAASREPGICNHAASVGWRVRQANGTDDRQG